MILNDCWPTEEKESVMMATAVLLLAVVVIGLGSTVEFARSVRMRHEPALPQGAAVQAALHELDARPWLVWFGVAALAVLAPGLLSDDGTLGAGELGLGVVVLGLAGERGQFLARLLRSEHSRAGWGAVATLLTVLGGVAFGSS